MWKAVIRRLVGLRRYPYVVVTDRYPPEAHGGAEVSLHICLRRLELADQVLVVKFNEQLAPSLYSFEGVTVLSLCRAAAWPNQWAPMVRPHPLGGKLLHRSLLTPSRAASQTQKAVAEAAPRGGPIADHFEYAQNLAVMQLRFLVELLGPKIVHADNYRSIMLTAAATKDLGGPATRRPKLVGVVRDNRFHCVRYDQSLLVQGKPCGTCDLACATHDSPRNPELQRDMLELARLRRHASLQAMDRVIVTSEYLRQHIEPIAGKQRLVLIPNAADDGALTDKSALGVAEEAGTHVVVVGMLNEAKGQVELAQQLPALVERVPDVVLHFAGRGARVTRRIKALVAEQGLAERVRFHDYLNRKQLYQLYAQCQIVLLPTRWPEPFGRVPLEAGAARRPCVAFAVGGLKESIIHDETGLLVAPGDYNGLINAIGQLADTPEQARKMGSAARTHILARYNLEQINKQLYAVWTTLAD